MDDRNQRFTFVRLKSENLDHFWWNYGSERFSDSQNDWQWIWWSIHGQTLTFTQPDGYRLKWKRNFSIFWEYSEFGFPFPPSLVQFHLRAMSPALPNVANGRGEAAALENFQDGLHGRLGRAEGARLARLARRPLVIFQRRRSQLAPQVAQLSGHVAELRVQAATCHKVKAVAT